MDMPARAEFLDRTSTDAELRKKSETSFGFTLKPSDNEPGTHQCDSETVCYMRNGGLCSRTVLGDFPAICVFNTYAALRKAQVKKSQLPVLLIVGCPDQSVAPTYSLLSDMHGKGDFLVFMPLSTSHRVSDCAHLPLE